MKDSEVLEWTAALRSGEYPQTTRRLHVVKPYVAIKCDEVGVERNVTINPGYCCLGVLCKIRGVPEVIENLDSDYVTGYFIFEGDRNNAVIPIRTAAQWGLTNTDYFVDLNDSGKTFLEIADEIERMLLGKEPG